ncbi:MAG TPA: alpha/beta hydrolase [Acidobacteriaceae bacterium]|nr:alpha/beta hydrolase [Acidobacteriaceae bacterium]
MRTHLQALAVLREVGGQPVPWVAREVTGPIARQDLTFTIEAAGRQEQVRARIYSPANRPNAPAMVIFHGVHHLGIDEPRLMGFADAMASCGIRVLTPELPDIKDYRVSESSVQTIGGSVKWLAAKTGRPVGVMGLSFSGGLALVAAADPLYHRDFKFVMAVGSQDSMARVTEYYRTGSDLRPDGSLESLPAHEYGPLVLEYEYLEDFVPAQDLAPLRAVLRAHLYEERKAEAEASLALNAVQKREALGLMDATSAATHARIAATARKHAREMSGLSPGGRLDGLDTPVYLLHGEADNIIPSAETLWMASELRREHLKAMLVSPVLSHLDLDGAGPSAMDNWRLLHFFAQVMQAAERR